MFQDLTWKVEFYLSKIFLIFVSLRRFSKERRNALETMGVHNSNAVRFGCFQKCTKTYEKFCIDSIDIKS